MDNQAAAVATTPKGRRIPLNMRTYKELFDKLERAAWISGRSISAELEYRIERSFWIEHECFNRNDNEPG